MSQKTDRRKIRTKKLLRQAMLELIDERGLKRITVSDLTKRADINRGTFYLHYRDVDDLMEQYQEELLNELMNRMKHMDLFHFIRYKEGPYPVLVSVLEFIAEQANLFKVLLGPKGDPSFLLTLKQFLIERISEKLSDTQPDQNNMLVPPEYLVTFVASAHLGIIQYWLESGLDRSPEEVAAIMTSIAVHGPLATIGLRDPGQSKAEWIKEDYR